MVDKNRGITKLTVRVPVEIARALDGLWASARARGERVSKQEIVLEALRLRLKMEEARR